MINEVAVGKKKYGLRRHCGQNASAAMVDLVL
jgi:hypothetical protein